MPDVFRREVMDVIGASNTWRWIPYHNSFVDVDGKQMASVSGGTRWGGGVWINAQDMARFGYLWLRGGKWGEKQILPPDYVKAAVAPSAARPRLRLPVVAEHAGQELSGPAANAYGARGAGSNTITILARSGPGGGVALARRQRGRVREAGGGGNQADVERSLTSGGSGAWTCAARRDGRRRGGPRR